MAKGSTKEEGAIKKTSSIKKYDSKSENEKGKHKKQLFYSSVKKGLLFTYLFA